MISCGNVAQMQLTFTNIVTDAALLEKVGAKREQDVNKMGEMVKTRGFLY